MMFHKLVPFFLICLLASCKPSKPSGVLSESRMVGILVDYHLAQGMAEGVDNEVEKRYTYVQAVFRKHRISEQDFDKSMVYYCEHAEELSRIYLLVNKRIESAAAMMGMETDTQLKYHELSNVGDTANIWNRRKSALLKPNYLENIYSFVLDADSSIYYGDSFMWTFTPRYVLQGGKREAFVQLAICYENDSVASNAQMISGNQEMKLKVEPSRKQDTLRIKSIQGHVYLPLNTEGKTDFRMLMLTEMALIRYHKPGAMKMEELPVEQTESIPQDSVSEDLVQPQTQRLSPAEVRETQQGDQRINIVKEKPVDPRLRPSRNINQPLRRQQNKR